MTDLQSESIELSDFKDIETEVEFDKNEKDDKVRSDLNPSNSKLAMSITLNFQPQVFFSIHHPEISTPPPEYNLYLS